MLKFILILCSIFACTPIPGKQIKKYLVEIGGTDYGMFEVCGLENFDENGITPPMGMGEKRYSTVTFSRHFVTQPSLYLWAWSRKRKKNLTQSIYLSSDGEKIVLLECQPLAWMIERSQKGGYYEKIDVTAIGLIL